MQYIINQQYLKIDNSEFDKIQHDFFNSNQKSLLIKSSCCTGKTRYLESIINQYSSVLYVSYRRSLSLNIQNTLTQFVNYMDTPLEKLQNSNYIIISLDSLWKVKIKTFELIIIDESESLLNHFSARLTHMIEQKYELYDLLITLCNKSIKVIMLDNDIGIRSITLAKHFEEFNKSEVNYTIVTNTYTPVKFTFQTCTNNLVFINNIEENLKHGRKIVVVCMSKKYAERLYTRFCLNFKTLIYTSETPEDIKRKDLVNVNTTFVNCQLLIYSATIEAGCDFSVLNHFNKIYVQTYSSENERFCSVNQRSLYQMIRRCRYISDTNITILVDKNLPYIKPDELVIANEVSNKLDSILHINAYEASLRVSKYFLYVLKQTLNKNCHEIQHQNSIH